MTMQEQQDMCRTCDHKVNNPDPGWCYMFDSLLVGCCQYEKFVGDSYRVDCKNEDCTWSGLSHDCGNDDSCPECGGDTEPVAE